MKSMTQKISRAETDKIFKGTEMTDEEKEKIVNNIAAVVCGFTTWEEIKKNEIEVQKNLERERWQAYQERKKIKDKEKRRRLMRQYLRLQGIISKETEYETVTQKYID